MKKILILLAPYFIFILQSFAQAPDTLWTKTFGYNMMDRGYAVQQTFDGGYIIAGSGNFEPYYSDGEGWLIKTDSKGNTQWIKVDSVYHTYIRDVKQTPDTGYIIVGSSFLGNYNVKLVKTDASGDTIWTKTFGGSADDEGSTIQQTTDGGYIICGTTQSFGAGGNDVWLIKTDTNGDTTWTKTFGGIYNGGIYGEQGNDVQQTTDGGYIVCGYTESFNANNDVWLIKTDVNGDTIWTRTFGGSKYDNGESVLQTTDGGYIICGYTESFGAGSYDVWLIKIDANGDSIWTKTFGGSEYDYGESVIQTAEGGYIVCGYTGSCGAGETDVWLIKTDANGEVMWTKTIGGDSWDWGSSVQQTTDGGFIIIGGTTSFGAGDSDIWLIKLASDPTDVRSKSNIPNKYVLKQNYPNPFNPSTKIRYSIPKRSNVMIKVYDILGNEIETLVNEEKPAGTHEATWNAANLPSGVYFYQIKVMAVGMQAGKYVETKKMILLR